MPPSVGQLPRTSSTQFSPVGPTMEKLGIAKQVGGIDQLKDARVIQGKNMVTLEYSVGSSDGGEIHTAQVVHDTAGRIRCTYCSRGGETPLAVGWCRHIAYIVSGGFDGPLYSFPDRAQNKFIIAPVTPSEGVFLPLVLDRDGDRFVRVKVSGIHEDSRNALTIGILLASAVTSKQVRSIYADWLMGNYTDDSIFKVEFDNPEAEKQYADYGGMSELGKIYYRAYYGVSLGLWLNQPNQRDMPSL